MERKYHLSNLPEATYIRLARDLVSRQQVVELEINKDSVNDVDLIYKHSSGQVLIAVQVKNVIGPTAKEIDKLLHSIKNEVAFFSPSKFILVNFSTLEIKAYKRLSDFFLKFKNTDFIYYGVEWIQKQLNDNPDIVNKYYNQLNYESTPNKSETILESERINQLINSGRNFFAVGHFWGKENQMERFIEDGIWENGHEEKITNTVNSVKEGDVIFLKSTYVEKGNGTLRIKAIGVVSENPKDGHLLRVNWHLIDHVNLPGLSAYRNAISRINSINVKLILEGLNKQLPELYEIIEKLDILISYNYSKRKPLNIKEDQSEKEVEGIGGGSEPPNASIKDSESNPEDYYNGNNEQIKDKIPFHIDKVVDVDKLGREPVAKAFVRLIKNDIFTDKLAHSFMVHLQGEWGAGKSSFLQLIKKNLNSEEEEWIVVDYNAWQNQHIKPPWWTLIDHIYRKTKLELNWWCRFCLWLKESFRRIIWYSGWQKIAAFLLTIAFTVVLIKYGSSILDLLTNKTVTSTAVDNEAKGLTIEVFAKLIITLGSVFGVIYSFSKFLSTPFFLKTPEEAVSFMRRASDPMNRIKKHFGKLVDNINSKKKKRQLAIFIDDIDRCNKEFIVNLLEGIQTLFKEKRVLYIVAGDKKWITTSFGNTYEEFSNGNEECNQLGELFLEKAFQLSFRMPNVEKDAKQRYWNYILGLPEQDPDNIQKLDSVEKLNKNQKREVRNIIQNTTEDITANEFMKNIENTYNLNQDAVSDLIIEEKNSDTEEIQHLLKNFHSVIDPNPRSIIRLANNYTMTRSILIAERKDLTADKIFRWLVVEDLFPKIKAEIKNLSTMEDILAYLDKEIEEGNATKLCKNLLTGEFNEDSEALQMEEIKNIIGF
ncbi:MAG TPA: hypothetical protein DCG75_02670 [Bacteroidales bacterium]|nr:hypothetical protein [Bacteroidales bacterium]